MPTPDEAQAARRESCAAAWYGLDAVYRHDDPFEPTLLAITGWAETLDRYDAASIDIFTGDGYRTLSGTPQPRPVLDEVHAIVAEHPQRVFHTQRLPHRSWAGATLCSTNGSVLGCLSLWSVDTILPADPTRDRLLVLARATMHALEERRRISNHRKVVAPGPRVVTPRTPGLLYGR